MPRTSISYNINKVPNLKTNFKSFFFAILAKKQKTPQQLVSMTMVLTYMIGCSVD